jgi:hypothetical protein
MKSGAQALPPVLLDESCGAAAEDLRFQTSSSNAELKVQT